MSRRRSLRGCLGSRAVMRSHPRSVHSARCSISGEQPMSHFSFARSRGAVVLAAAAILAAGAASGAVAGAKITGKDIKDHSIKAKDLDAGSVTTNKVKNGTLKLKDLSSEVTGK